MLWPAMGYSKRTQDAAGWAILPRGRAVAVAALLLLTLAALADAGGPIYSFVGPDGVIHFTDTPRDARYRKLAASDAAGRAAVRARGAGSTTA